MTSSRRDDWLAASITGLITSTYSTLTILLGSHRVGRGITLSFMEVGSIVLRDGGLRAEPGGREFVAGLLVHQSADITWAVVFFGLLARWTRDIRPLHLLLVAPLWGLATAAFEYYALLPWLQPIVIMQTPFWIPLLIHLSSAGAYPLYYLVRARISGGSSHVRFSRRYLALLVVPLGLLGIVETLFLTGSEPRWLTASGEQAQVDRSFMRRMALHHRVGETLSLLSADKSTTGGQRSLGRLMDAEQRTERSFLEAWWTNWYGDSLPASTHALRHSVPGMPTPSEMDRLRAVRGASFDRLFVRVMIDHHRGGIAMAEEELGAGGDPRLRLLAQQIIHAQQGQIDRLMELYP